MKREDAFRLLKEHRMPKNILEHSLFVNKVAMYLARRLKENGVDINLEVVDIASLLHDLDKIYEIERKDVYRHGKTSYKILKDLSPEVAKIVKKHTLGEILKRNSIKTWEEKIVFYADKRVGDKIVTLGERYDYLRKKYGSKSNKIMEIINKTEPLVKKLEREVFNKMKGKPEDLFKLQKG